jgi:hypothetical protein
VVAEQTVYEAFPQLNHDFLAILSSFVFRERLRARMVILLGGGAYAMGQTRIPLIVSAILLLGSGVSSAQPLSGPLNYDVKTLTFELWCQETQRYPAERCDARRPADLAAFEAYRASIERYELQYLKQVDRERQIRDSVNRDPMQSTISRQDSGPGASGVR